MLNIQESKWAPPHIWQDDESKQEEYLNQISYAMMRPVRRGSWGKDQSGFVKIADVLFLNEASRLNATYDIVAIGKGRGSNASDGSGHNVYRY